jgi:hypothetical protein
LSLNQFRSLLYFVARLAGDLNAIRRGPGAVVKRLGRKSLGRAAGRSINRLFR